MEGLPETATLGDYRLHARIAQGGMAEVLLATSKKLEFAGQFLAIKKLLPHLNANKPFVNLLIHEAKIGVLLNHPGIVSVYDLGSFRSEFFLAMEFVHGKSLDQLLKKIKNEKAPPLTLELSSYIILEILRALAFAHDLKDQDGRDLHIVHRDLTPGNIMLGYEGEIKLTDFGIATAENRLQPGFTNSALGKLYYMAPEQVVRDPVVRASDIYSLGVVYYELLTGQLPFRAKDASQLYKKVVEGKLEDLKISGAHLPSELQDILKKMLHRSLRQRFQTSVELYHSVVEFFKAEFQIDFNSRISRKYFRSQLSKYLTKTFKTEMQAELEIIQKALSEAHSTETLNLTAPQVIPQELRANANLEDAETRQYPISESERRMIIEGFDPSEVEPKPDTKRIGFAERLKISSLDRDNKETLSQLRPHLEIRNEKELVAFDVKTFSGGGTSDRAITLIPEPVPLIKRLARLPKIPYLSSHPYGRQLLIGGGGLLLGLLLVFGFRHLSITHSSWNSLRSVGIFILGETEVQPELRYYENLINSNQPNSFHQIEAFFNREFSLQTHSNQPILKITPFEPKVVTETISENVLESNKIFKFLEIPELTQQFKTMDAVIFLYFYSSARMARLAIRVPDVLEDSQNPKEAILFMPANSSHHAQVLQALTEEIAHLFGATSFKSGETSISSKVAEELGWTNLTRLKPKER